MKLDLTGLVTAANRKLTPDESNALEAFAARRLDGEPVARILGQKEFWSLPLKLSAETLVPRPDTETVVELALEIVRAAPPRPLRIADPNASSQCGGVELQRRAESVWPRRFNATKYHRRESDMNHIRSLALALLLVTSSLASAADGLVAATSPYGPKETMDRVEILLKEQGMTIVARVDHAAGAA